MYLENALAYSSIYTSSSTRTRARESHGKGHEAQLDEPEHKEGHGRVTLDFLVQLPAFRVLHLPLQLWLFGHELFMNFRQLKVLRAKTEQRKRKPNTTCTTPKKWHSPDPPSLPPRIRASKRYKSWSVTLMPSPRFTTASKPAMKVNKGGVAVSGFGFYREEDFLSPRPGLFVYMYPNTPRMPYLHTLG